MLASGWQMIYNDHPNEYERVRDVVRKQATLMYSIGLVAKDDGTLITVLYGGPSFKAGLGPGMKITEVAGQKFTLDALRSAVTASTTTAVQLKAANGPQVEDYTIDYHGGAKFPHLQRVPNRPDMLDEILHPLSQ